MISFSTLPPAAKAGSVPTEMVFGQNDRMAGSVPVRVAAAGFAENLAQSGVQTGAGVENSSGAAASGEADGFGFEDLVDIINPLQHLPVVGYLYRSVTGDTIGTLAQIAGGALFGGAVGGAVSAGMAALDYARNSASGTSAAYLAAQYVDPANRREGLTPFNV